MRTLPRLTLALLTASAALLLAACGADGPGAADAPTPAGRSAAETAPDFTLALAGGGEFTLSEAQRPVYLIFWAEW